VLHHVVSLLSRLRLHALDRRAGFRSQPLKLP
jgi:hypothetical protein